MSDSPLDYSLADGIATLRMDDGKRNALSPAMFRALYAAFDRAEADAACVILTGREDIFSAGFDLKVMKSGGPQTLGMLRSGFSLTARVLSYPYPVVAACNGHALAMGVFLMLSADYVLGSAGDFKIAANEVAIGLPLPRVGELMLRHRLQPAAFQRAATLAEYFTVDEAASAGFFDTVVPPEELMDRARAKARDLADLDRRAHRITKQRLRAALVRRIRRSVPLDLADAALTGLRGGAKSRGPAARVR